IVDYTRSMNMIRGYFYRRFPAIRESIGMPTNGDWPTYGLHAGVYGWHSGYWAALLLANAAAVGVVVDRFVTILSGGFLMSIHALIAVLVATCAVIVQAFYAVKQFGNASERAEKYRTNILADSPHRC